MKHQKTTVNMMNNLKNRNQANGLQEKKEPWARLCKNYPINRAKRLKTSNNLDSSRFIDINVPQFNVGRIPTCHYILSDKCGIKSEWIKNTSKVQFQLYQDTNSEDKFNFIRDLSRNGTFLNGELIGQNQKRILKDKDVISVIDAKLKVFTFRDLTPRKLVHLPKEITEIYFESKKVGSGAFGVVYKVYDRKANPYAVKYMKTNSMDSDYETVSNNEIEILSKIEHVCVIKTIDTIKSSWGTCLVLEFMNGGDLLRRTLNHPNRRLPEDQCRCIFYQMTEAVNYLHNMGITHRDLKPDNILLDSHNEYPLVKLSDFGLSKYVGDGALLKSFIGTHAFIAPEVLRPNFLPYTSRVDIWAMGVTLFFMLSGSLPFNLSAELSIYEMVNPSISSTGDYEKFLQQFTEEKLFPQPCWDEITFGAIRLISNMLVVNPWKRINIRSILQSPWLNPKFDAITQAMKLIGKDEEDTDVCECPKCRIMNDEEDSASPCVVS